VVGDVAQPHQLPASEVSGAVGVADPERSLDLVRLTIGGEELDAGDRARVVGLVLREHGGEHVAVSIDVAPVFDVHTSERGRLAASAVVVGVAGGRRRWRSARRETTRGEVQPPGANPRAVLGARRDNRDRCAVREAHPRHSNRDGRAGTHHSGSATATAATAGSPTTAATAGVPLIRHEQTAPSVALPHAKSRSSLCRFYGREPETRLTSSKKGAAPHMRHGVGRGCVLGQLVAATGDSSPTTALPSSPTPAPSTPTPMS